MGLSWLCFLHYGAIVTFTLTVNVQKCLLATGFILSTLKHILWHLVRVLLLANVPLK